MAKASMTLPDGTTVQIEGSADEIQKIISLHKPIDSPLKNLQKPKPKISKPRQDAESESSFDLMEIVNHIKNCDEAESIEKNILDRTSQVDRILLPLFIMKAYINEKMGLTSGDISRVLGDLGINIYTPNVANSLSGPASKYVIGDKVRRKGQAVKYKISRRGEQYLTSVIENKADK
jgi:hypothetical protein